MNKAGRVAGVMTEDAEETAAEGRTSPGKGFVMSLFTKLFGLAVAGVMVVGAGCQSSDPNRDRSTKAADGISDVRDEVANANKELGEAMSAVSFLQNASGDLAKPFEKARSEVSDVEKAAGKVSERAADMRNRAKEYQAKWAEQTATLSSEDLKMAAAKRAETVRARFAKVDEKAAAAKAAYPVYMSETKELLNYLGNDLTPGGIKSADAAFKRSNDKGNTVKAALNDLTAELDGIVNALAAKN